MYYGGWTLVYFQFMVTTEMYFYESSLRLGNLNMFVATKY